jgi:c-di-GMP-binding flagellar brake protein YcgR
MMIKERRKSRRIDSINLLSYVCLDENNSEVMQGMGRTLNVGEGGILLETHVPIDQQCIVYLTISMEDDLMSFKGNILYQRKREDGKFELGIEFKEMDEQECRFLKQFIILFRGQEGQGNVV